MTHTTSRTPWRFTPVVLVLACALSPAVARAQASTTGLPPSLIGSPSLGPAIGRLSYGLLGSLDIPPSGFGLGPRFSGELMYGFMDLAPQLRLDLGGRASFNWHGLDGRDASTWLFEVVFDTKLRYAIDHVIGIYGDVGLGPALLLTSGANTPSDHSYAVTIQFGTGVAYTITPRINLLGEVRFDIYTKSGYGLTVAVPTVGLEFH